MANGPGPGPGAIDSDGLELSYRDHERLNSLLHGDRFRALVYADRRYLVLGAGGDSAAAIRRAIVYRELRDRPFGTVFQLEDFQLTPDDLALWASLYEHLCDLATHIVIVLENYQGGYVWELGYLFHRDTREKVWVLKREYGDAATNRAKYDNGMAASHLRQLETAGRTYSWGTQTELKQTLENIP